MSIFLSSAPLLSVHTGQIPLYLEHPIGNLKLWEWQRVSLKREYFRLPLLSKWELVQRKRGNAASVLILPILFFALNNLRIVLQNSLVLEFAYFLNVVP